MTNKELPQQKAFKEKKDALADMQKHLNSIVKQAAKDWVSANPQHSDLDVLPQNIAYIKSPQGTNRAIFMIAERMMWSANMEKTQDQIREEVQKSFPELVLKKGIWTKKLTGKTKKRVESIITGNMQKPPSFAKCASLSQYRRKVLTHKAASKGLRTFKLPIIISREAVIIGSQSYALEMGKVGKYTYPRIRIPFKGKRQPLRIDLLVTALKAGEGNTK